MKSRADAFRARAEVEAGRYGPDPWVFVRELVQNARDAGATRVDIRCGTSAGYPTVEVRDDGEGMAWADAQRYLFSLYTSSKEGESDRIGCFGVGFWSILRARPIQIAVRSRSARSSAWGLVLRGDLEEATREDAPHPIGTTVELTLPPQPDVARRVTDAALQNVRFVTRRGSAEALEIFVDGEAVHRRFELPAPSVAFRARGLRGVVALATTPGVELFSRGLRVRVGSSVRDLAGAGSSTRSRVRFAEVPGALAPKVLLDSDRLALPLSRNDAKDDRELRAVIERAEQEISRLVEGQLDRLRPPSMGDRAGRWLASISSLRWPLRATIGLFTGVGLGALVLVTPAALGYRWHSGPPSSTAGRGEGGPIVDKGATGDRTGQGVAVGARDLPRRGYYDLASRYTGPRASLIENAVRDGAVDLGYVPSRDTVYFAVLYPDLSVANAQPEDRIVAREEWLCRHDCVEVDLSIDADAGVLSLPLPPGHRVDSHSARIDNDPLTPLATSDGRWIVMLPTPRHGRLRYRTGPDAAMPAPLARTSALTPELSRWIELTADLRTEARVTALEDAVRQRVRYETSEEVVAAYERLEGQALTPIERALAVGAGDCDLQNAMLTELLRGARIPARLAVGWVGKRGRAVPVLHAWTEWIDDRGRWRTADANSSTSNIPRRSLSHPRNQEDGTPRRPMGGSAEHSALQGGEGTVAGGGANDRGEGDRETRDTHGLARSTTERDSLRVDEGTTDDFVSLGADGPSGAFANAQAQWRRNLGLVPAGSGADWEAQPRSTSGPSAWRAGLLTLVSDPLRLGWLAIMVSALALISMALGLWLRRRGDTSALCLNKDTELVELLHGALTQPAAFSRVPSIFERRLIPCLNGSAVSIREAREHAGAGLLACARRGHLSQRAIRSSGRVVIDMDTAEGRRAALHLGAFDMDLFRELWDRAKGSTTLERVELELRRAGQPAHLRISTMATRPVSVAPLSMVDPTGAHGARRVMCGLIDSAALPLQRAQALERTRPALAAFVIAEFLFTRAPEIADAEEATLRFLGSLSAAEADRLAGSIVEAEPSP